MKKPAAPAIKPNAPVKGGEIKQTGITTPAKDGQTGGQMKPSEPFKPKDGPIKSAARADGQKDPPISKKAVKYCILCDLSFDKEGVNIFIVFLFIAN